MKFHHIALNTTHSECRPSSSMHIILYTLIQSLSALTRTSHPTTFIQADTQSSPVLRSTCPNHPVLQSKLPHLTSHHSLQPRSEPPTDCITPHNVSYPSATPRTSISLTSVPSSPDFANSKTMLNLYEYHMICSYSTIFQTTPSRRTHIVQEPCEKRGGDLEQIATEWISTDMHSNHHGVSAGPKSPHLSIVEFFLS